MTKKSKLASEIDGCADVQVSASASDSKEVLGDSCANVQMSTEPDNAAADNPTAAETAVAPKALTWGLFCRLLKKWANRWFIEAFTGMAQGLFATLIAGTIIEQIGNLCGGERNGFGYILILIGKCAKVLTGAGIGVGIAHALKADKLVLFTAAVAGLVGGYASQIMSFDKSELVKQFYNPEKGAMTMVPGNPIASYITTMITVEVARLYAGRTKLDIILVPIGMMLLLLPAIYVAWPFIKFVELLGKGINFATGAQPVLMGIVISVAMGILLTMPTSSAAIWVSICLPYAAANSGVLPYNMMLASGAAVVGCSAHMVGFGVATFKENGWGGLFAQGVGTSMLQIPNIMKKPLIMVPQIIASAIVGPLATGVFGLLCNGTGGGMGTSGMVGVIQTVAESNAGGVNPWLLGFGIALLMFVIPAVVSWGLTFLFKKLKWIRSQDLVLPK